MLLDRYTIDDIRYTKKASAITDAFEIYNECFTLYALRFKLVYAPGKLAFQICSLVLMNNALFGESVNE